MTMNRTGYTKDRNEFMWKEDVCQEIFSRNV